MHIDWLHFTPWTALAGGMLIGLAAALLVLLDRRIAGINGILGGLLRPSRGDLAWRLLFLGGIVLAPLLWSPAGHLPAARIDADTTTLLLAGLLVGVGTRYGAGCTSGHGVCGMARGSPRSFLATATFVASGFLTVWLLSHAIARGTHMHLLIAFGTGLVFGLGLLLSGLANPAKVLAFLDLAGPWDPSLLFTMGGAVAVAAVAFRIAGRRGRTLLGAALRLPSATGIDRRLVLGSVVFGIGWGLAGFCPGPAIASLATGSAKPLLFVLAMVAGMGIFELAERLRARHPETA